MLTQAGFAVAAGIALAALVMVMLFSPSLTALIGQRAWWPGHSGQRVIDKEKPTGSRRA